MADAQERRERHLVPSTAPKVFGIGLHKTSTTSLANALYTLGYYTAGYFDVAPFTTRAALEAHVIDVATRYDAVQDMPWPSFFRLLDEHFPGSRFVLTVRDPAAWITSVVSHFGSAVIPSHELFYGVPTAAGAPEVYLERFHRHTEQVRAYFADRPDDLLVMDIAAGDGWNELCPFLGCPAPELPFPRQNARHERSVRRVRRHARSRIERVARRAGAASLPGLRSLAGAEVIYEKVHEMTRRFDGLVGAVEALSDDAARLRMEAEIGASLRRRISWLVDIGEIADRWPLDRQVDTAPLAAWQEVRLRTRRWTAHLTDDGCHLRVANGSTAVSAIRRELHDCQVDDQRLAALLAGVDGGRGPVLDVSQL